MRKEKNKKDIVVVEDENLAKLAKEVLDCRGMINSVGRMTKAKVEDIKCRLYDFGDVKVQAGDVLMDLVQRAGSLDVDEFKKRLIASGVDPRVIEEESKQAMKPPSVVLKTVSVQDLEVR